MQAAKTDQTRGMPRLIWVFAGHTDRFVMRWLMFTCDRGQTSLECCFQLQSHVVQSLFLPVFTCQFNSRPGLVYVTRIEIVNPIRALVVFVAVCHHNMQCQVYTKLFGKLILLFLLLKCRWHPCKIKTSPSIFEWQLFNWEKSNSIEEKLFA